jgi:hypothetical protein
MIPLLHKSIKKNWKFKSLRDLWVRERSFFLSFFLCRVLSWGKKNSTHFPQRFHQVLHHHHHHQLGCSCRRFLSSRLFLERDRIGLENLSSEIQSCAALLLMSRILFSSFSCVNCRKKETFERPCCPGFK